MHDFSCAEPDKMYYDELAQRARFFKESKEGVVSMCKAMEEMWDKAIGIGEKKGEKRGEKRGIVKGTRKAMLDTAKRMLKDDKLPLELIAEYSGLPLEEVVKLKKA